jgi:hypothetical protein
MIASLRWSQLGRWRPSPVVLVLGAFVVTGVGAALVRYVSGIGAMAT